MEDLTHIMDSILKTPTSLKHFLNQNAYLFQFSVEQILQIHNKNSEATVVASQSKWRSLNRIVRNGSLPLYSSQNVQLYAYADTLGARFKPYDWSLSETKFNQLLEKLKRSNDSVPTLSDVIKDKYFEFAVQKKDSQFESTVISLANYSINRLLNQEKEQSEILNEILSIAPQSHLEFFRCVHTANQLTKLCMKELYPVHLNVEKSVIKNRKKTVEVKKDPVVKKKVPEIEQYQQISLLDERDFDISETKEVEVKKEVKIHNSGFSSQIEYPKTFRAKLDANILALRTLKQLEGTSEKASFEEKQVLSQYSGWGGLSEVFDSRSTKYEKEREIIRTLVSEKEYEELDDSILTAYYTDTKLIDVLYQQLERMGFKGGKILDPAMGSGNFFSAMPEAMKRQSQLTGVEIDTISGKISKYLHDDAEINIIGFEKTTFKPETFDLVIGNIPFNDFNVIDPQYNKPYLIHDYFIKKSIDLAKKEGIVLLFTSNGTLDKLNAQFRKEISEQADLLGAIRLPNTAFKDTANTRAVSDILFFQKKSELGQSKEVDWIQSLPDEKYENIKYNEYFHHNPQNILGDIEVKHFRGGTLSVKQNEEILHNQLDEILKETISNHHSAIVKNENKRVEILKKQELPEKVELERYKSTENIPYYSFELVDGKIYYRSIDGTEAVKLSSKEQERMHGLISIRNSLSDVIDSQTSDTWDENSFQDSLTNLNQNYDKFVEKFGYLNEKANKKAFSQDDKAPLLLSIEKQINEHLYEKEAIFFERTIQPNRTIDTVNTGVEALNHSLRTKFKIDLEYMQTLYPKAIDDLISELDQEIFLDPLEFEKSNDIYSNCWVLREEYLSGDVKEKLEIAKQFAQENPNLFDKNVAALETVQPVPLNASEIEFKIGSTWIPKDIYMDFMVETFEPTPYQLNYDILKIEFNQSNNAWFIKGKNSSLNPITTQKYGTKRATCYKIFEDSLNLKDTEVRDTFVDDDGKKKSVLNTQETILARSKQEKIQFTFNQWLFKDPKRTKQLVDIYNDTFNRFVLRKYEGTNIEVNGLNKNYELRPHQKRVVSRIVQEGRALMGHCVGSGKTLSMISAGMVMKDQGLIHKPMYVVPNHLTTEFGQELLKFFPTRNILITTKKDFVKENRQKFISRIATGNYDAVIIGHSQFEKISISKERQAAEIKKEIQEITDNISKELSENNNSWSYKQMKLTQKRLNQKLKNLNESKPKDEFITFEQLGVDFLFVDEAHAFKNLYTYTKLSNVAGVNSANSQRASDMLMKVKYLQEKNHGKGVVFATGTPISNSMSEMFTMQRFLQPDILDKMNVSAFDRWASTFGQIVTSLEITPEGSGYQQKTRFAKFHNLPELMTSFSMIADIQTEDMLDLPVPKLKAGKRQLIVTKATNAQEALMNELGERAEKIRNSLVDPSVDNMLKLTNDAKLMAIDLRLIDDSYHQTDSTKIETCCQKVFDIYERTKENKSTQIIFSDSGTPKKDRFNIYDEVKRNLIEKGISENEIAFIHDAKNEKQRENMFEKMRKGELRVLLGSTEKVGTGTNIQDKLIAGHHIDVPWRPSDLIQRDGRIIRQGNENNEVEIFCYVTKGTFDSYLWQIQEQKLNFITQVMTNRNVSRSCADLDEVVLDASEAKAIASNNPLIKEKSEIDNKIHRLQLLKSSWVNEQQAMKQAINDLPKQIEKLERKIELYKEDCATVEKYKDDDFSIEINSEVFTNRKEAGEKIIEIAKKTHEHTFQKDTIGIFQEFNVNLIKTGLATHVIELENNENHEVDINLSNPTGITMRISHLLNKLPEHLGKLERRLDEMTYELKTTKKQVSNEFEKDHELSELLEKQLRLNMKINGVHPNETKIVEQQKQSIPKKKSSLSID